MVLPVPSPVYGREIRGIEVLRRDRASPRRTIAYITNYLEYDLKETRICPPRKSDSALSAWEEWDRDIAT
jgi:hypothetical protein